MHEVPLTGIALSILNETRLYLRKEGIGSPWMFPSPRRQASHITPEAVDRAVKRNADLLGNDWTPHVLRASCATWLDELGIATNDIALLLNHKPPGQQVTHRYMRRQGIERKRAALEKWETFLREECGVGAAGEVVRLVR